MGMLDDKVVVVTGAGGGIGRGIALMAAAEGAKVVVNDLGASVHGEGASASAAETVVDEIRAAGGTATASGESVSTWESAQRIIEQTIDTFGRIDALVNNAGILRDRFFFKMEPDEWRAVIDVHLNGTFYMSRAAAPHFRAQGYGSYVHMTSTSGLIGGMGQANYAAAKMGIVGLSRSISIDMAQANVRSNCISPFAFSRMIGAIPVHDDVQAARVEKLKKMDPGMVAPLAVFLATDDAKDVTGQVFAVRANEIFLMSQSRPLRSVHRPEGWTPRSVAKHAIPAMKANFYGPDMSKDVFSWDPI